MLAQSITLMEQLRKFNIGDKNVTYLSKRDITMRMEQEKLRELGAVPEEEEQNENKEENSKKMIMVKNGETLKKTMLNISNTKDLKLNDIEKQVMN